MATISPRKIALGIDRSAMLATTFREWLLKEIRWFSIEKSTTILLPDEEGVPQPVNFRFVDPRFERYKPRGISRHPRTGELIEVPYNRMIANGGTGWEGLLPFTRNRYLIYDPDDPYGKIGSSMRLPRLPDDWYTEALFSSDDGVVVYDARPIRVLA